MTPMSDTARSTVRRPPISEPQEKFILGLLRDADRCGSHQPALDTLAHHGGKIVAGHIEGLSGGRGGTASLLIDDLKTHNYRPATGGGPGIAHTRRTNGTVDTTTGPTPAGGHRGTRERAATSPAGDRFRAATKRITPTAEQAHVIALATTPNADGTYPNVKIEAGAGTGKTATLLEVCRAMPARRGLYTTFNRAIVDEGDRKFPKQLPGGGGVSARTMHSLAWRATDKRFIERMEKSFRILPDQVAARLGIQPVTVPDPLGSTKPHRLKAGVLASIVTAAINRFAQTADPIPARRHFGRQEGLDADGKWDNHNLVFDLLEKYLPVVWDDLCDPDASFFPYSAAHYLKQWSLTDPVLPFDYILIDEAQDISPVMMNVIEVNLVAGKQIIAVGDSFQAINEWTGAVDALKLLPITASAQLTQSFRFGHRGAAGANWILERLGEFRLIGNPDVDTVVGPALKPVRCTLYRSNAAAIAGYMDDLAEGGQPFLMGRGDDFKKFCRYARVLQLVEERRKVDESLTVARLAAATPEGKERVAELEERDGKLTAEAEALAKTRPHADLKCFETWTDVRIFVSEYDEGKEIKLQVSLVDRFGAMEIVRALDAMPKTEDRATAVHSTAHKVKGCEWDSVALADDFPDEIEDCEPAELKLLYVAFTRGKLLIDPTRSGCLGGLVEAVEAALAA
jgi:hypothetical protein